MLANNEHEGIVSMYIYDNYYLRDKATKMKHLYNNIEFDKVVRECSKIDSIADYHLFKKYVLTNIKNKTRDTIFARAEFASEGLHYGHRKAFFDYAEIDSDIERFIFPFFEHGADLRERVNKEIYDSIYHSFLFQAPYKNDIVHQARPLAPVYNIGPYILYAKRYYDEQAFNQLKEKMGKTVLLFPAHTFEGASVDFDKNKFVKDVLSKFKNEYDTILVSVYWNDVDDPVYDAFEAAGAKLVSAGFRGDQIFIARLRAIIELSDLVASNLTGSYVGFSQALKKPLYMFSDKASFFSRDSVMNDKAEMRYMKTVDDIFMSFSVAVPTAEQITKQKILYEKYWGGEKYFKSKQEAKEIISVSQKLLGASKGTTAKFESVIRSVMSGYDNAGLTDKEIFIMKDSLNN